MTFEMCDRVKVINFPDDGFNSVAVKGRVGTVCKIHFDEPDFPIEVEFDEPIPGIPAMLFREDELEFEYNELVYDPNQQPDLDEDI